MKKTDRKKPATEAPTPLQLVTPLVEVVRDELRAFVIAQGSMGVDTRQRRTTSLES